VDVQAFLQGRFAALNRHDYAAVYASYHSDAPFLQQFDDLETYLCFARQQLGEIKVKNWQCLRQRSVAEQKVEAIIAMEIVTAEGSRLFYEMALLIETADGWRYHSAQKLSADDYSGRPEQLDFRHFDDVNQKIRF